MKRWLLLTFVITVCLLSGTKVSASEQQVVSLAATDWCPYVCEESSQRKGMVVDYLEYLGSQLNIEFKIQFYPWSRAIKEVQSGQQMGLITAVPSEVPGFSFTSEPTMHYQMCFFTEQSSTWHYNKIDDLLNTHLGVIADYGYGEPLDSYITTPQRHKQLSTITGGDTTSRLLNLLHKKRVDVIAADRNVIAWQGFIQPGINKSISNRGCLQRVPFFMAFNPALAASESLVEQLNHAFAKPAYQQYLIEAILPRYQQQLLPVPYSEHNTHLAIAE